MSQRSGPPPIGKCPPHGCGVSSILTRQTLHLTFRLYRKFILSHKISRRRNIKPWRERCVLAANRHVKMLSLTHPQTVFVVGGSAGLGKEMSKVMAARGAYQGQCLFLDLQNH